MEESEIKNIIKEVSLSMDKKGYNSVMQIVGYLVSNDILRTGQRAEGGKRGIITKIPLGHFVIKTSLCAEHTALLSFYLSLFTLILQTRNIDITFLLHLIKWRNYALQ